MCSEDAAPFRPGCAVVICTRNRPEDLSQCLEAVKRLNYPRFEVLVVDNAPRGELWDAHDGRAQAGSPYLSQLPLGCDVASLQVEVASSRCDNKHDLKG